MIIYPAIDIMGGEVVRLSQGRFDQSTTYSQDPAEALHTFEKAGAEWVHIVDLDGARASAPAQHGLIASLVRQTPLSVQVGGGFRTRQQVARMVGAGAARVLIGSLAVKEPGQVAEWIDEFGPDRLALSLDVRMADGVPIVAVSGWTEASGLSLWDVADLYPSARHLLLTDISRDGMLTGPNFELLDEAVDRLRHLRIQASGGVSSVSDIQRLRTDGAVIGKAIWEGRFTLEEALSLAGA